MKSFIVLLFLVIVLQVRSTQSLQCYDCQWFPVFGSGRTACPKRTNAGYGSIVSCPDSKQYCKVSYDFGGGVDDRSCAETCTDTYEPHGGLGQPLGTYCCTSDRCNGLPDPIKSGLRCYYCGSAEDCDESDSNGTFGQAEDCIQGKNVCKATFNMDQALGRGCAERCGSPDDVPYSNDRDFIGRVGDYCCHSDLCNGPGPATTSAGGQRTTLMVVLASTTLVSVKTVWD